MPGSLVGRAGGEPPACGLNVDTDEVLLCRTADLLTGGTGIVLPGVVVGDVTVSEILRTETVGGARLLAASATALVWANSPWSAAYDMVGDVQVGADSLGLHLELSGLARKFIGDPGDWVAQVAAG